MYGATPSEGMGGAPWKIVRLCAVTSRCGEPLHRADPWRAASCHFTTRFRFSAERVARGGCMSNRKSPVAFQKAPLRTPRDVRTWAEAESLAAEGGEERGALL